MIFALVGRLIRAALGRLGIPLPPRRRTVLERLWNARTTGSGGPADDDEPAPGQRRVRRRGRRFR